ncbi:MAG: hypothetical protein QM808_08505 [Steroidobacteraceae bacterium]
MITKLAVTRSSTCMAAVLALSLASLVTSNVLAQEKQAELPVPERFGNSAADEAKRQVVFGFARMIRVDRQKARETYWSKELLAQEQQRMKAMQAQGGMGAAGAPGPGPGGAGMGGMPQGDGPPPENASGAFTEAAKTADGRRGEINFGPEGQAVDLHMVATVKDDMVILYWTGGVDVFRVENGKITGMWYGSPQTTLTLYGAENRWQQGGQAAPAAAPATQKSQQSK